LGSLFSPIHQLCFQTKSEKVILYYIVFLGFYSVSEIFKHVNYLFLLQFSSILSNWFRLENFVNLLIMIAINWTSKKKKLKWFRHLVLLLLLQVNLSWLNLPRSFMFAMWGMKYPRCFPDSHFLSLLLNVRIYLFW